MNKKVNQISEMVIDGEQVYCVTHTPTGICAIFDYDECAKNRHCYAFSGKRANSLLIIKHRCCDSYT